MTRPTGHSLRVLIFGFYGMGNLGNEACLGGFLRGLRAILPQARPWCLGTNPEEVAAQHDIPARTLMVGGPVHLPLGRRVLARLLDVPRTWWLVGAADVIVVPGAGTLESSLGAANPFGLPYWMFVLGVMARVRRRPMMMLSIGAEKPRHWLTAFFFRRIMAATAYRSFRDQGSAEAVRTLTHGRVTGPVYPDLAFGLPRHSGGVERVPGRVVVGVIKVGPPHRSSVATAYESGLVKVLSVLAAAGDTIRLVVGDVADFPIAERLAKQARDLSGVSAERVAVARAEDQAALVMEMSRAEVVIATRYHNVIAALQAGTPVVSLGYAEKHAALLDRFGLSGYHQSMEAFDADMLLRQVSELRARHGITDHNIVMTELENALNEQYRRLMPLLCRRSCLCDSGSSQRHPGEPIPTGPHRRCR
jgi:polysaccharide pyruvyl transferase WcaK-like protein